MSTEVTVEGTRGDYLCFGDNFYSFEKALEIARLLTLPQSERQQIVDGVVKAIRQNDAKKNAALSELSVAEVSP